MKRVDAGGRALLLVKIGGEFRCFDNHCPHMGGDLSKGQLSGTVVQCPRHGSRFDLVDGRVVRWTDWSGVKLSLARIFRSPRPLTRVPIRVGDGKVFVNV